MRVNVPGEGPRASGSLVRWNRLQIGELAVEIQGGHRLLNFQLEGVLLRGHDDSADDVAEFAQAVFVAMDKTGGAVAAGADEAPTRREPPADPAAAPAQSDVTRVAAVIFDLDGVLVDSEIWWDDVRLDFARRHGRAWTLDDQAAVMGANSRRWARIMRERLRPRHCPTPTIERAIVDGGGRALRAARARRRSTARSRPSGGSPPTGRSPSRRQRTARSSMRLSRRPG